MTFATVSLSFTDARFTAIDAESASVRLWVDADQKCI
jgi:hypothetical protein